MKKRTCIYWFIVIVIMGLTILNMSGKGYKLIGAPEVIVSEYTDDDGTVHGVSSTDKITLTRGSYKFIINYSTTAAAKIEACVGRDTIAEGLLEADAESAYYVMEFELGESTSEFYFRITDAEGLNVYNYEIIKNGGHIVYDDIYYSVLILILSFAVYLVLYRYWTGKYDVKKLITLLSLAAITVFVSSPVLNEYLIYGFDIQFHLSRIEGIKDAFRDGQLIPVIYPNCNNGYGVLGIMYPSLFLVPSALLRLCNVSMVASYHFFILLNNVLTILIAWISGRSFTKSDKVSLLCVLLCACNPLRLTNLYTSAAVGSALGIAFMPLVFAGLYEVIYGDKKKWYYITIAFSGMLMSHVLSCVIVAIVSVVVVAASVKELIDVKEKRYVQLLMSIGVFLLINSWYIILFIRYYSYSLNGDFIFSDHYYKDTIIPTKLFMMSNTNMVAPQAEQGILDGCMQGPGIAGLLGLFAILADVVISDTENPKKKKWTGICLAVIAAATYLGTSAFPWYKVTQIETLHKFMGTVQFPYRFYAELSPMIFILAPVSIERIAARQNTVLKNNQGYLILLAGIIGVFSVITGYTIFDTFNVQPPLKTVYSGGYASYPLLEYLPTDTDTAVFDEVTPHNFGSETLSYSQDGTKAVVECKTYDEGAYVLLPMLYYPGYKAVGEDGTKYAIGRCPDGRIQIFMPVTDNVQKINVRFHVL